MPKRRSRPTEVVEQPLDQPTEAHNGQHSDGDVDEHAGETQTERLRRRAAFLRDLAEAKELRARVRPRRTRVAKLREALRRATYHSS